MRNGRDEQAKSRLGTLGLGLLLLVTIGAAGCEQRKDTHVVETPNGTTTTTNETVGIDKDRVKQAADKANQAAAQAGDAAGRAADKVGAAAHDAKTNLSDAGVTAKVKTRLATDNRVHAAAISVDTANGVVTVTGNVPSDAERAAVIEIVRGTDGVSDVVDHLTLVVPAPQ
jgi:osmotically-inducible protein OsmY